MKFSAIIKRKFATEKQVLCNITNICVNGASATLVFNALFLSERASVTSVSKPV